MSPSIRQTAAPVSGYFPYQILLRFCCDFAAIVRWFCCDFEVILVLWSYYDRVAAASLVLWSYCDPTLWFCCDCIALILRSNFVLILLWCSRDLALWFCCDFAVVLLWFCHDILLRSCCNLAQILLWFCCSILYAVIFCVRGRGDVLHPHWMWLTNVYYVWNNLNISKPCTSKESWMECPLSLIYAFRLTLDCVISQGITWFFHHIRYLEMLLFRELSEEESDIMCILRSMNDDFSIRSVTRSTDYTAL